MLNSPETIADETTATDGMPTNKPPTWCGKMRSRYNSPSTQFATHSKFDSKCDENDSRSQYELKEFEYR